MEDYSNLKGSGAVIPTSERIWGVQKKRKAGDRNPQNGKRPWREAGDGDVPGTDLERAVAAGEESLCAEGEEVMGYGARKGLKKISRQVDLVI
jgi:hypothetical protein